MDSLVDEHMDLDLTNSDVSPIMKKKLIYSSDDDLSSNIPLVVKKRGAASPPYRGVRALRLFDHHITQETPPNPMLTAATSMTATPGPVNRFRSRPLLKTSFNQNRLASQRHPDAPVANVNPFTPKGLYMTKKRTRSKLSLDGSLNSTGTDDSDDELPPKRIALSDANISRYFKEFHEVCIIGKGEFGSVYKCVHRLDGCVYAVKRSLFPVAGTSKERIALNEVWANAVLGSHKNLVRYYSAWAEEGHIVIQNEFCNGGTLEEWTKENKQNNSVPRETQLKDILLQLAQGLDYIHGKQMAHLDIKPSNIFICRESSVDSLMNNSDADDGFDEAEEDASAVLTYKIGDMGHVSSLFQKNIEEGDCRYLPMEVLQEDYSSLTKADIFSLGLTIYEAAGGGPLPKNGDQWQSIRQGKLRQLNHCSPAFHRLLESMIDPDPAKRPSALELVENPLLTFPSPVRPTEDSKTLCIPNTAQELVGKRTITPKASLLGGSTGGKKMCRSLSFC